ncbi:MAG: TOBE domain-containing protein [Methylotenera sp.]|uniref:TOBE domain-containing protein n=1 Tax=Methylotenera sp. TaxID=2051956 RepID=UPI0024874429|nr:TOBE domain-containing protein [Methylotenera sp.]MDI1310420.1 TOBE domain-containing protein [Methylotenera sp.]
MNSLKGQIVAIDSNNHMSLVDVAVGQDVFTATLLETPATADYLQVGSEVTLLFKETEIALAKNLSGMISLRNRIPVVVKNVVRGDILSAVTLDYAGKRLVSVITSRAIDRLEIKPGDPLEALIKANEIALMAGHDDL